MSEHSRLGWWFFDAKRWRDAAYAFAAALEEDPDDAEAHAALGLCLSQIGDPASAMAHADRAVALMPQWWYPYFARGQLIDFYEGKAAGEAMYAEALRLDPGNARVLTWLAARERDRARSLAFAERAMETDPLQIEAMYYRSRALSKLNRDGEAAAAADASLAADPQSVWSHTAVGWAALDAHDIERAMDHFAEALRIDPGLDHARRGMSAAMSQRGWMGRLVRFFALKRHAAEPADVKASGPDRSPQGRRNAQLGLLLMIGWFAICCAVYPSVAPWIPGWLAILLGFVLAMPAMITELLALCALVNIAAWYRARFDRRSRLLMDEFNVTLYDLAMGFGLLIAAAIWLVATGDPAGRAFERVVWLYAAAMPLSWLYLTIMLGVPGRCGVSSRFAWVMLFAGLAVRTSLFIGAAWVTTHAVVIESRSRAVIALAAWTAMSVAAWCWTAYRFLWGIKAAREAAARPTPHNAAGST